MEVVYFSGATGNTARFVGKLGVPSYRIPLKGAATPVSSPYVLIVPTYVTSRRAVPPQVVEFLNHEGNRRLLRGVIGTGNTNFNKEYCLAARIIAGKCDVPLLHMLELLGTPEDVTEVQSILADLDTPIAA